MYTTNNSISFHQYADDTQLYIGTNSSTLAHQVALIESCTQRVHDWLLNNGLHLNPTKSDAIAFFNPRSKPLETLAKSITSISVAGSPIKLQSSIKNLGVYLDSKMSFDKQVSEICKASYFHHSCSASHSIFSHHGGLQDNSYSNSRISTRLLQLSSSWHIYLKPCSTTACTKYTCSSCYPKISVQSHLAGSF